MSQDPQQDTHGFAKWLSEDRYGSDPSHKRVVREQIEGYLKLGLGLLQFQAGETLLDVGCGDGILGFYAKTHYQDDLQLICTDIDEQALEQAKIAAKEMSVTPSCRFAVCPAGDLSVIESNSVDIVATRSSLAYVDNKPKALQEFLRVLKPKGQLLLIEPIFQDEALAADMLRRMCLAEPSNEELQLLHIWKSSQYPDHPQAIEALPLTNFSERQMFSTVQQAGFEQIHLQLHMNQVVSPIRDWQILMQISPHLWAPSLKMIAQEKMSEAQRQLLESAFRPLVEAGTMQGLDRMMYLRARKKG